jgi:glycosyltransferase involved in cell wall biosynthesis
VLAAGLGDRMRLAGRVDTPALHAWYEAASVFVHPTLYEGSSLVTLEAMAHRRPVVATMAGGLPDKVQPGVTGWLVPPGDAAALAAALREALSATDRLSVMGDAGRHLAEEEFSWSTVTDRLLTVYDDLLVQEPCLD